MYKNVGSMVKGIVQDNVQRMTSERLLYMVRNSMDGTTVDIINLQTAEGVSMLSDEVFDSLQHRS